MSFTDAYRTLQIAREERKLAFSFSHLTFEEMKRRGNTHYCFRCGGKWGFTPDKNGNPINCEDDVVWILRTCGVQVTVEEAIKDRFLCSYLVDNLTRSPLKKDGENYKLLRKYPANFNFNPKFIRECRQRGFKVQRYNPMKRHSPTDHADAIIGKAEEYSSASEWFANTVLPDDFPFIIALV